MCVINILYACPKQVHVCHICLSHMFVTYACHICLPHMFATYVCHVATCRPAWDCLSHMFVTYVCRVRVDLRGTGAAEVGIKSTTRFQMPHRERPYVPILSPPGCHESRHTRACELLWVEEYTYMWFMPSAPRAEHHTQCK